MNSSLSRPNRGHAVARAGVIGALLAGLVAVVDPLLLWNATGWAPLWTTPPAVTIREGLAWLGTAGLLLGGAVGLVPVGGAKRDVLLVVAGLALGLFHALTPWLFNGLGVGMTWLAVGAVLGVAAAIFLVVATRVLESTARGAARVMLGIVVLALAAAWITHPRAVDRVDFDVRVGAADRPNLLLIVLDTVRADHLALYGGPRQTTPRIDAFARQATVYEDCMSPAPWTLPTHASLFTGLPATTHGCNGLRQALDTRWTTLAEHLQGAGYQTVGISSNPFLDDARGFHEGFDLWRNPIAGPLAGRRPLVRSLRAALGRPDHADDASATAVNRRLAHWFGRERDPAKPWFLFVNHIEAHAPYAPPSRDLRFASDAVRAKWRDVDQHFLMQTEALTGRTMLSEQDVRELKDLYDDEIAFVDAKVGELLDALEDAGELDDTAVVITSDHGEQFGEHGLYDHVYSVDRPLLHVPMIVRWPGQTESARDAQPRQTHDLFASFTALAGVDDALPIGSDAHDLRADVDPARERLAALESPLISNVASWAARLPDTDYERFVQDRHALRRGAWKLSAAEHEASRLYDVVADPQELVDRALGLPDSVVTLEQRLRMHREALEVLRLPPGELGEAVEVDPEKLERLKALGYVN